MFWVTGEVPRTADVENFQTVVSRYISNLDTVKHRWNGSYTELRPSDDRRLTSFSYLVGFVSQWPDANRNLGGLSLIRFSLANRVL